KSFDAAEALMVPGVKRVVEMPAAKAPYGFQAWGGIAVIADNTWAALQGRSRLKIDWQAGPNGDYDSAEYKKVLSAAVAKPGKVIRKTGDVERALEKAARRIEAQYHVPHLPHAAMEPIAVIAHLHEGQCDIWAPTQNAQVARKEAATVLGLPESKVHVHVTFLGGAFGRKSKADFVSEAAFLAKTLGTPVRVQWSREDDFQHDYYNTVSTQLLTAGLDAHGKVTAWRHRTAFPPIPTTFGADDIPTDSDLQQGVLDLPLAIPNVQAEGCRAPAHARIGWLRSVYNIFHAFANNSFIDELAHAKKVDTRELMLELIGPPRHASLQELGISKLSNYGATLEAHPVDAGRLRHVVERVTEISGWKHKQGRALGLAAHRSFLSYVAAVVSLKKNASGQVVVDEVWTVIDAGKIINRDRVRSQMEGAVIFGMSIAFYGAITMKRGVTEQSNFDTLKLMRMQDVPRKIHVEIVESDLAPGGVGEPGVPPVAPAIANALFALTGQRVRELPIQKTAQFQES
ncbi:MAG: xanthine dehydrogenase family protein molybdopterin-binding subunit, partial [Bdellovibrionota bacterium]